MARASPACIPLEADHAGKVDHVCMLVARPEKPELDYLDPCWRPDGSTLFNHLLYTAPAGILRFDPGSGRVERLSGAESYRGPKCSPDGSLLAVDFERGQPRFVLRRAGTTLWENVPAAETPLQYPSWWRDGRSFCGLSSQDGAVKCFSLADSTRALYSLDLEAP